MRFLFQYTKWGSFLNHQMFTGIRKCPITWIPLQQQNNFNPKFPTCLIHLSNHLGSNIKFYRSSKFWKTWQMDEIHRTFCFRIYFLLLKLDSLFSWNNYFGMNSLFIHTNLEKNPKMQITVCCPKQMLQLSGEFNVWLLQNSNNICEWTVITMDRQLIISMHCGRMLSWIVRFSTMFLKVNAWHFNSQQRVLK